MSYRNTRENRHFGRSFKSVGGVEAEILMFQNTEKSHKKSTILFSQNMLTWNSIKLSLSYKHLPQFV